MRSISQKTTTPYGVIILAVCLLTAVLGIFMAAHASAASSAAAGKRLITIHDDGQDKGILTRATTLRQAMAEADIHLDANDTVEPGLDEQLVGNNYEANIYRARPVTIVDGAVRTKLMSPYRTASQIVKQAGMTLQDEDTTQIDANTNVVTEGSGVSLTITRATPFTLVLYGKQVPAYTQAKTVADMLKEKKITLTKDDTLSVAQSTPLTKGLIVELWRNGKQTQTVEEEVNFDTEKVQDSARDSSYHEVKTPGEKGKRTVTYEIMMKNGVEVGRAVIQSVVTAEPKKQVEIVGTKIAGPAEIISRINYWAGVRGIDATKVARIAKCESSFNPNAGNGRYQGLFQHDSTAWADRAIKYGVPGASIYDAEAQIVVSTGMMASSGYGAWECQ
jgi:uncharacterized protein YabE (DUF348 family)